MLRYIDHGNLATGRVDDTNGQARRDQAGHGQRHLLSAFSYRMFVSEHYDMHMN